MTQSAEPIAESTIQEFWNSHPCGDAHIGGLDEAFEGDYRAFFNAYDSARYQLEAHIPACLDALALDGSRVLEVGLGQGAESEQLVRRGARWTGLDLTKEAVQRVQLRMQLHNLAYEGIRQGSVTAMPFDEDSFDVVFSHGVLHHVPDIEAAEKEIHRVLRPGGRLIVMLYARRSLNYQVSIRLVRRGALAAAWPLRHRLKSFLLAEHLRNAEREGLVSYLRLARFLHASTDGPSNPFSRVYGLADVERDFQSFQVVHSHKHFMHAPPLPVHGLPGGAYLGWHLWVEMTAR